MVAYATWRFSALVHTTVYIDAGAYEWISPAATASMLQAAGISHARGFALNDTQYDTTARELGWGQKIERRLASLGVRGKHFLVSTSMNGVGFLNGQYHGNVANARVCSSPRDSLCTTLGIPPHHRCRLAEMAPRRHGEIRSPPATSMRTCGLGGPGSTIRPSHSTSAARLRWSAARPTDAGSGVTRTHR